MTEKIRQRIGRIREHVDLLETLRPECVARFSSDPVYRGAVLHYLYLAADGCVVLAEQIIRLKKLRAPQSYSDAIDILGDSGVIPADFAYSFAAIAGFRNFLAHDYEKVDGIMICSQIMSRLDDVKAYLSHVEENLSINPSEK